MTLARPCPPTNKFEVSTLTPEDVLFSLQWLECLGELLWPLLSCNKDEMMEIKTCGGRDRTTEAVATRQRSKDQPPQVWPNMWSCMQPLLKSQMESILNITSWDRPGKYLGLPAEWARSKSRTLSWILEKVQAKMEGWKESLQNLAGKEVLIKAIVQAIPTFAMAVFKFPRGFCKKLNSLIATGNDINIWSDRWLWTGEVLEEVHQDPNITLESMIDKNNKCWNQGALKQTLPPNLQSRQFKPLFGWFQQEDKLLWPASKDGQ
ncbi:hypothetical protein SESBI_04742 [Sesbania bispinosa]|nr:hypothetical protein SESBI_04742 [Sesbania bispinosa]